MVFSAWISIRKRIATPNPNNESEPQMVLIFNRCEMRHHHNIVQFDHFKQKHLRDSIRTTVLNCKQNRKSIHGVEVDFAIFPTKISRASKVISFEYRTISKCKLFRNREIIWIKPRGIANTHHWRIDNSRANKNNYLAFLSTDKLLPRNTLGFSSNLFGLMNGIVSKVVSCLLENINKVLLVYVLTMLHCVELKTGAHGSRLRDRDLDLNLILVETYMIWLFTK